jgi:hypothetical protein
MNLAVTTVLPIKVISQEVTMVWLPAVWLVARPDIGHILQKAVDAPQFVCQVKQDS